MILSDHSKSFRNHSENSLRPASLAAFSRRIVLPVFRFLCGPFNLERQLPNPDLELPGGPVSPIPPLCPGPSQAAKARSRAEAQIPDLVSPPPQNPWSRIGMPAWQYLKAYSFPGQPGNGTASAVAWFSPDRRAAASRSSAERACYGFPEPWIFSRISLSGWLRRSMISLESVTSNRFFPPSG